MNKSKSITLLEPFFAGSHKQWAETFQKHSKYEVNILSMPGRHWKWRMHGGAVSLAAQFNKYEAKTDLILATDMLDLSVFLALTRKATSGIPIVLYFHENQITYPWSPNDPDKRLKRDNHYGFVNYTSALSADRIFFNSEYHLHSFLDSIGPFLKQFPDFKNPENIELIKKKSNVLPLIMDLSRFDIHKPNEVLTGPCIFLWNHRWEYDKNPDQFFKLMYHLKERGLDFKIIVLGERYSTSPKCFSEAQEQLSNHILHWGFVDSFEKYATLLWHADVLPVTSYQDFFGGSIVEAIACDTLPLLPDRLAYPEHIPETLHKKHLYSNEKELFQMTEEVVLNIKEIRKNSYRSFVEKYDASILIEMYDQAFF